MKRFLARAECGELCLTLPDGRVWRFGPGGEGVRAELRVARWRFFWRILRDGDVGLGDGWVESEWDSQDPVAVVRFFLENRRALDDRSMALTRWLGRAAGLLRQWRNANTSSGSRRNIRAHYDLGNRLYQSFLGPTMTYSCAHFADRSDGLEQAQWRKIDRLLDLARLEPGCHLLEVGCGWGTLAIRAARRFGCRVTGITLSQEQMAYAQRAVSEAGLNHLIEVQLLDYRALKGRYDRVIACEMLEAVGHQFLGDFFGSLEKVVRPEGLLVLQVITVPDFSYADYRRNQDWIQKEIFPGALCPALSALLAAAAKNSRWVLEEMSNIGPHYARTLRIWRERFLQSWPILGELGYDLKFQRAWRYYLSYCEAAFATRNLANLQLVFTRPQNRTLLAGDPGWLESSDCSRAEGVFAPS